MRTPKYKTTTAAGVHDNGIAIKTLARSPNARKVRVAAFADTFARASQYDTCEDKRLTDHRSSQRLPGRSGSRRDLLDNVRNSCLVIMLFFILKPLRLLSEIRWLF